MSIGSKPGCLVLCLCSSSLAQTRWAHILGNSSWPGPSHDGNHAHLWQSQPDQALQFLPDFVAQNVPVSWECVDLLTKLLEPEPELRMGVADIIRHPFFAEGLPSRGFAMNDYLLALAEPEPQASVRPSFCVLC